MLDPAVVRRLDTAAAAPVALALVDGKVSVVVAPSGRLTSAILFKVEDGRIVEMDVIADPAQLRQLRVSVLEG